jgi:hypothetical protein
MQHQWRAMCRQAISRRCPEASACEGRQRLYARLRTHRYTQAHNLTACTPVGQFECHCPCAAVHHTQLVRHLQEVETDTHTHITTHTRQHRPHHRQQPGQPTLQAGWRLVACRFVAACGINTSRTASCSKPDPQQPFLLFPCISLTHTLTSCNSYCLQPLSHSPSP